MRRQAPDDCDSIEIRNLPTADLALAANIFVYTQSIDCSDRLITTALNRQDALLQVLPVAAIVRHQQGKEEEVLALCRQLTELDPKNVQGWRGIALVQKERENWKEATAAFRKALEAKPDSHPLKHDIIDVLIRGGEREEARKRFTAETKPESGVALAVHLRLESRLLVLEGSMDAALAVLETAMKEDATDPRDRLRKGQLLYEMTRTAEAQSLLEELLVEYPSIQDAYFVLGTIHSHAEDKEKAQHYFDIHKTLTEKSEMLYNMEHFAGLNPEHVEVRRELVKVYASLGLNEIAEFWHRAAELIEVKQ
jgi:tetratricopeptide (TPR) repeat protein